MWDKHWCRGATTRVGALVNRMEPFLRTLRERGVMIVHAPSDTMDFYKDTPQRRAIQSLPAASLPAVLDLKDPPLPVDSADGGCDTDDKFYKAWKREHPGLTIAPGDFISDNGQEIYNALKLRGIHTLLVMGVHTNMCILNRSFAIRQMTKWGIRCILVRDLTDAMYDPNDKPYVVGRCTQGLVIEISSSKAISLSSIWTLLVRERLSTPSRGGSGGQGEFSNGSRSRIGSEIK
jgi:nicotinamidase-related amidase